MHDQARDQMSKAADTLPGAKPASSTTRMPASGGGAAIRVDLSEDPRWDANKFSNKHMNVQ